MKKYNEMSEALKCIWSKEQKNMKDILIYFRDMNYPITQQTEEKRQESKNDYIKEEKENTMKNVIYGPLGLFFIYY